MRAPNARRLARVNLQDSTKKSQMLTGEPSLYSAAPTVIRPSPALILLAGPGEQYWRQFRDSFQYQGAEFVCVGSGRGAIDLLRRSAFDRMVLDDRLSDIPGMAVLTEARRLGEMSVSLMTTGGPSVQSRGFDLGADDVVGCGLTATELAWRAETVLRRTRPGDHLYQTGEPYNLILNQATQETSVRGAPLRLTATEFAILRLLLEHRGAALSADAVSQAVWRHETYGSPNFVQAQISRLRAKLKHAGAAGLIATIRGAGYVVR